jgi:hypothetical protein
MKRYLAVAIGAASIMLMGFTFEEAAQALNGEWQGRAVAVALSLNLSGNTGTYVDGGMKISGPLSFKGITGQSIEFSIGSKSFVAHVLPNGGLELSEAGKRGSLTMVRTK